MPSLISDAQKNQAAEMMDNLAQTYQKLITVITEVANATIIDDGSYNSMSDRKDSNITYSANVQEIYARIKFLDKPEDYAELIFAGGGGGQVGGTAIPLSMKFGVIRLKIDKQYESLVAGSSKIIVNGEDCQFIMNYVPQSLFDTNYSLCYVNRQK